MPTRSAQTVDHRTPSRGEEADMPTIQDPTTAATYLPTLAISCLRIPRFRPGVAYQYHAFNYYKSKKGKYLFFISRK